MAITVDRKTRSADALRPRHATADDALTQGVAWDRIHSRLTTRSAWSDRTRELSCTEGTLIRVQVDRLPGGGDPLPLWPWSSATGLSGEDVDVRRQTFLRRFDIEHTFRLVEQALGWTRPKLRTPGPRSLHVADHLRPHPAPAQP
jgi:hypothetical protein